MKVLLIQPNRVTQKGYFSTQYPINLGCIASALMKDGNEVRMADFNIMDRAALPSIISEFKPEMVGLTAMTSTIYNARDIISEVKQIDKNIITVLGGVHASALPVETMEEIKDLDYLVFGEGEVTAMELVKHLESKKSLKDVDGLVYRENGKIVKNKPHALIENLSNMPYPARELLPPEMYTEVQVSRGFSRSEMSIIEMMTGRGCPNQCIFCAGHINFGFRVRFRSYEHIVGEIKQCMEKYGTNHISFEDDTFTLNKPLVKQVCAFLKENKLTWNCNTRVNTVDYDLLKLMAESGCKKVAFGVESGNPEIMRKNKKGITIPEILQAFKDAKRAGIRFIEADFMLGSHIDETKESINDTIKLINKLMPDFLFLGIICPFPGTEIYKMMEDKGFFYETRDWSQFSVMGDLKRYKRLTYMTPQELWELQHKILKDYYGSPKYMLSQLSKIRSFGEIKYFIRMGQMFLKDIVLKRKDN
ncbi:radical SAM protein [archaeon]|nr:MAG: radical SAM protein [archaeon]